MHGKSSVRRLEVSFFQGLFVYSLTTIAVGAGFLSAPNRLFTFSECPLSEIPLYYTGAASNTEGAYHIMKVTTVHRVSHTNIQHALPPGNPTACRSFVAKACPQLGTRPKAVARHSHDGLISFLFQYLITSSNCFSTSELLALHTLQREWVRLQPTEGFALLVLHLDTIGVNAVSSIASIFDLWILINILFRRYGIFIAVYFIKPCTLNTA